MAVNVYCLKSEMRSLFGPLGDDQLRIMLSVADAIYDIADKRERRDTLLGALAELRGVLIEIITRYEYGDLAANTRHKQAVSDTMRQANDVLERTKYWS